MQEWIVEAWSRVEHGIPYVSYGLPKEEIIRCRDCAHNDKGLCCELEKWNGKGLFVDDDDFCSFAKKEE